MKFIVQISLALLCGLNSSAGTPAPSPDVAAAIEAFDNLKSFAATTQDICSLGPRIWTKVYAARTAYGDVSRSVVEVGNDCADAGDTDVLGLTSIISKRVARLKQSQDYKNRCLKAWQNWIAIERVFVKGPEQIIENFQSRCFAPAPATTDESSATR